MTILNFLNKFEKNFDVSTLLSPYLRGVKKVLFWGKKRTRREKWSMSYISEFQFQNFSIIKVKVVYQVSFRDSLGCPFNFLAGVLVHNRGRGEE